MRVFCSWSGGKDSALALFLFLLFASVACGESGPRIISLSPPLTEELYLLGLGQSIVGNTIYCVKPEDAKKKEKVGSVVNVNLEKILKLKPDLVLASPLTDKRALDKLQKIGIDVHVFSHPKNFQEIKERFLKLSEIVGRKETALKIVLNCERVYFRIKQSSTKEEKRPKVFVQIGRNPLFTATKDSILNSFIEDAGGENIGKDSRTGLFSEEEVLLKNPEYIIVVGMGLDEKEEKERWSKLKELRAVRDGKIFVVDSYKFCSPTVVTYVSGVKEIGEILKEEVKNGKRYFEGKGVRSDLHWRR